MGKNVISVEENAREISEASRLLSDAEDMVRRAKSNINDLHIMPISTAGLGAAGIMSGARDSIIGILSREVNLLDDLSNDMSKNAKTLSGWDDTKDKLPSDKEPKRKNTGGNKKEEIVHFIKEIDDNPVFDKTIPIGPLRPFIDVGPFIPVNPPINPVVHQLEMLENYLQKGDLVSAAKAYKFLKTFGKQAEADALLAKYGYKATEKNGEYVISKIEEEKPQDDSTPDTEEENDVPNEEEVIADETTEEETTEEETPKEDTVISDDDNKNEDTVVTPTPNNNDNGNNNGGNNTSYNSTSSNQNVVENTSTDISGTDATTETETITDSTTGTEEIIKDKIADDSKTNVVTITDDSETTTTKKSSGLGAAVPIGLGTIAAGAAAVAGVRYVKNRHENQEEYSEEYDDENNNLDSDSEYQDSAQYDNGSTYMDDDYLGPIDTASSEDGYVDPTDLEEIEELSDDSVLEELNSNY